MAGTVSVMKDVCAGENCRYYLVCETQNLVFSKDTVMFYCMSNLFVAFFVPDKLKTVKNVTSLDE